MIHDDDAKDLYYYLVLFRIYSLYRIRLIRLADYFRIAYTKLNKNHCFFKNSFNLSKLPEKGLKMLLLFF